MGRWPEEKLRSEWKMALVQLARFYLAGGGWLIGSS